MRRGLLSAAVLIGAVALSGCANLGAILPPSRQYVDEMDAAIDTKLTETVVAGKDAALEAKAAGKDRVVIDRPVRRRRRSGEPG